MYFCPNCAQTRDLTYAVRPRGEVHPRIYNNTATVPLSLLLATRTTFFFLFFRFSSLESLLERSIHISTLF